MDKKVEELEKTIKLSKASYSTSNNLTGNPWSANDYDKLDTYELDEYKEVIQACRYFYKRDPIASTVINKLVDIGVTPLIIDKGKMSDNEYRIIDAIKWDLQEFLELGALEYLVTGLVIPEVEYKAVTKNKLMDLGIKKYDSMLLPEVMWYRDSGAVIISNPLIPSRPVYYIEIPDDLAFFILNKGTLKDGTIDLELYREIAMLYPELVAAINAGKRKVKLDNNDVIRRRYLSNSPYPVPYLYSALEALKHKRNLRRMDYSIASRIIGAIQLITLGDKDFPLAEEDFEQLDNLKSQMTHRESANKDVERVFQLFGNHTLKISWVFPDTAALLDEAKYKNVNSDIIYSLGIPNILITGETERTGTSDPEFATLSPIKTMNEFRRKLLNLATKIINRTLDKNKIKNRPSSIRFENVNMHKFSEFVDALVKLNDGGTLSKTTIADLLGFDFMNEVENRKVEKELLDEYGLTEFDAKPYSPQPGEPTEPTTKPQPKEVKNE